MKKDYASPQTGIERAITVQMLCASGGGGGVTPPPGIPVTDGGDPNNAI